MIELGSKLNIISFFGFDQIRNYDMVTFSPHFNGFLVEEFLFLVFLHCLCFSLEEFYIVL